MIFKSPNSQGIFSFTIFLFNNKNILNHLIYQLKSKYQHTLIQYFTIQEMVTLIKLY